MVTQAFFIRKGATSRQKDVECARMTVESK